MSVSSQQFVERLLASGIVSAEVGQRLLGRSGQADSESVARQVVEHGLATAFQARALLEDKPRPLVLGDYVLLEELGAGGMGVVYRARHRRMDRIVALKVLARGLTDTPAAVQRFYREVRAAARLHHPNVVMAFDASESAGEHYLVMELVEGTDLETHVRESGPLSLDTALGHVLQAAHALAFAHGQGIVHRDVKPGNLLLARDGTLKLLDLGLARLRDSELEGSEPTLTQTGFMLGTIAYMAPEHAENPKAADERSDIYSLGCTLYRLLAGRLPYSGGSAVQLLLAAREQPIPDLRSGFPAGARDAEFLDGMQSVFEQMVAKQPEGRFPSMERVVAALEALRANLPPSLAGATWRDAAADGGWDGASVQGGSAAPTQLDGRGPPAAPDVTDRATVLERPSPSRGLPAPARSGPASVPSSGDPSGAVTAATAAGAPARPPRPRTARPAPRSGERPAPRSHAGPPSASTAPAAGARIAWPWVVLGALGVAGLAAVVAVLVANWTAPPAAGDRAEPAAAASATDVGAERTAASVSTPAAPRPPAAGPTPSARRAPGGPPGPLPTLEGGDDVLARLGSPPEAVMGSWSFAGGVLRAAASGPASLVVPHAVARGTGCSLQFTPGPVEVTAVAAAHPGDPRDPLLTAVDSRLRLVMVLGDGRALTVDLDQPLGGGRYASIASVHASLEEPPWRGAQRTGRFLVPGQQHLLEVHAHPAELVVHLDGQPLMHEAIPTAADAGFDGFGFLGLVTAGPLEVSRWVVADFGPKVGLERRHRPAAAEGAAADAEGDEWWRPSGGGSSPTARRPPPFPPPPPEGQGPRPPPRRR